MPSTVSLRTKTSYKPIAMSKTPITVTIMLSIPARNTQQSMPTIISEIAVIPVLSDIFPVITLFYLYAT